MASNESNAIIVSVNDHFTIGQIGFVGTNSARFDRLVEYLFGPFVELIYVPYL